MRYPKSSNLNSILNQWDNPKLSVAERNLIKWFIDNGLDEVTTKQTHQVMMWPVKLAYNVSPKDKNGRVLLLGEMRYIEFKLWAQSMIQLERIILHKIDDYKGYMMAWDNTSLDNINKENWE